jgi:O-antigen/teichoic acid export membrane protein
MDISKKKVFRDSLIYTILPKISLIASFLILPLISPYLTLKDYGIYGLLMAYISIFQIVIILGQNILIQNAFFTHKHSYKLVWKRSFGIMIIAGLISSIIFYFILRFTLMDELGNNWAVVLVMVSIFLIFSPIDVIVVNYYVLKEKALPYAYGAALTGIICSCCTLILIKYFKLGYMGWIISLPVGVLMSYIYYFRRIFIKEHIVPQLKIKKNFFLKAIRVGLPLTPHQISLYILGISDRLLLQYMRVPIRQIGLYSQGYNLGSQGNIIISGVFQSLTRKLQEAFRSDTEYSRLFIRKMMIFVPLIISVIFFSASLWIKEIFLFLFRKPELREAYPIAIVVLCSYMFWSIYVFFTYPLSIKNKTFSISLISLTAAGVNIIGNIILIPHFGIWAALGVTYFSYMIFGLAGLLNKENRLFLNRYINVVKLSVFLFTINITLFVIVYLSKDLNFMIKALFTVILAGCFGLLIKKVIFKKEPYALSDI